MLKRFNVSGVYQWFALSVAVITIDIYTKHLVQNAFVYGEHLRVAPFFDLVRYHNEGAAFSFLADAGGWQQWFFAFISSIAIIVISYLLVKHRTQALFCLGLALVLGGAVGNLYDRLTLGYVVDFLLFYYETWYWPAFNVADSAICIGVACLFIDSFKKPASQ